jgi:hypothetical protein
MIISMQREKFLERHGMQLLLCEFSGVLPCLQVLNQISPIVSWKSPVCL